MPAPSTLCPCGSDKSFDVCCEPYIKGTEPAPTAEALMRSRYTAFALASSDSERTRAMANYLVATQHPDYRSPNLKAELLHSMPKVDWLGLTIVAASEAENGAIVEFKAKFDQNEQRGELHERSSFVHENGRWLYTKGLIDPRG